MKVQVGTALPADNGTYKMPVSAGVTVERKLNVFSWHRNRIALFEPPF